MKGISANARFFLIFVREIYVFFVSNIVCYFETSIFRSCHIPLKITVTNDDVLYRRNCTVTIHFLDSIPVRKQTTDSESTNILGVLPRNTTSSVNSSLVLQPVMITDHSRIHGTVAFGCSQIFNIRLTVYCPSVYDVGRFQAVGLFDGDRTEVPIYVPPTYVAVIDQRV